MADSEIGTIELPATEQYRVVGVGALYHEPVETIGADGKPTVVYALRVASGREVVSLVAGEARRLAALGAIKPVGAPKSYDELSDPELAILATQRGIPVVSSGADSEQPLREDFINALHTHDLGADSALVGVSSVPGGVVLTGEDGSGPVLVDGVHPSPASEQTGDSVARGEGFDARGKSATEVAEWITSTRPNASQTIEAARHDPDAAATVLEGEQAASQGDPRQSVVKGLEKITGADE